MAAKLTVHEALIWVMVTTSASDHQMTEHELEVIGGLVQSLPVFEGFGGDLSAIADACVGNLGAADGLDQILDAVAAALPPPLRETAYALAVEVAATDVQARQGELAFLAMLDDRLELPKLSVAAIEFSARVRQRRAG
jgi:hypothetical protein